MAELIGCHESYIGMIERGTKTPSLETVINIANALNCGIDFLMEDYIKPQQVDPLIDEVVSLLKDRDVDDVRYIIMLTRFFLDLVDKKAQNRGE
jgi:transcriptional regulator with XRE-family HTH domain